MFDKWPLGWRDRPRVDDERLSSLLREWKGVEPRPSFEATVWRRIRAASAPESHALSGLWLLREWCTPRMAWVGAMTVALSILTGVGAGFSTPRTHHAREAADPLLHPQTLAGSYLTMVAGDTQ